MIIQHLIQKLWYPTHWKWRCLAYLLSPISLLYYFATRLDHWFGKKQRFYSSVPLIVIGNLTTGGTGKTPVLIALAQLLTEAKLQVGIISRGYKSAAENAASAVLATKTSSAHEIGDEPLLIFQHTSCPLAIHANRKLAINTLLDAHPQLDVILSDDGLQNAKLARDIEIIVLGEKGLGNGLLLPTGPLREGKSHLKTADFCIQKDQNFSFTAHSFHPCTATHSSLKLSHFKDQEVYAVAGIANPERFFQTLSELGMKPIPKIFPDHHAFQESDFSNFTDHPIIMTEKDAVKCFDFNLTNAYYLEMRGVVTPQLQHAFLDKVRYHIEKKKHELIVLTNCKASG